MPNKLSYHIFCYCAITLMSYFFNYALLLVVTVDPYAPYSLGCIKGSLATSEDP